MGMGADASRDGGEVSGVPERSFSERGVIITIGGVPAMEVAQIVVACRSETNDKYATEPKELVPCIACGEPLETCPARWEVLGDYHDGCFGWPACGCETRHKRDCVPVEKTKDSQ